MSFLLAYLLLALSSPVIAAEPDHPMFRQSGLPIPRFVSLKSSTINVRVGPGKDYPVKWTFKKNRYPVEVVEEFGHWRKVRDQDGDEGWVYHSLLSGKRTAIVASDDGLTSLFTAANRDSRMIAELYSGVMVQVEECNGRWCEIEVDGLRGWVDQSALYGVYRTEKLSAR